MNQSKEQAQQEARQMRDSKGGGPVQIRWIDEDGVGLVFFDAAPWELRVEWAVAPREHHQLSRAEQAALLRAQPDDMARHWSIQEEELYREFYG